MAAIKGRDIEVWRGAVLAKVAGVRAKSISLNGEPIDVTNDDDDGVRKLLADAAELAVELTVSGVATDDTLRAESVLVDGRAINTEFRFPGGTEKYAGSFFMTGYTENGEYKGSAMFEATFQSAGAVAYTPPA
jgi:predicted secreted protein